MFKQHQTCKYHARGYCRQGTSCAFSHEPLCKYFLGGYCRNGALCSFSHNASPTQLDEQEQREDMMVETVSSSSDDDDEEDMKLERETSQPQKEGGEGGAFSLIRRRRRSGGRAVGPARMLTIEAFEQQRQRMEAEGREVRRVRIVCLSDTHMKHELLTPSLPQGDDHILVHAGDFTCLGRYEHALAFNEWLGTLNYRYKFIVSGNHERLCGNVRQHASYSQLLTNGIHITHQRITLPEFGGLTLLLSSWEKMNLKDNTSAEPELFPWNDDASSSSSSSSEMMMTEPSKVDILVTHIPPRGILDRVKLVKHRGSARLLERVLRIQPTVHVFGHVHKGGFEVKDEMTFVNAANPGIFGPFVFDYYY
ncbi:metallophosphoesterase domain-containing protein 1 [Balamuthia mandrillaris]